MENPLDHIKTSSGKPPHQDKEFLMGCLWTVVALIVSSFIGAVIIYLTMSAS